MVKCCSWVIKCWSSDEPLMFVVVSVSKNQFIISGNRLSWSGFGFIAVMSFSFFSCLAFCPESFSRLSENRRGRERWMMRIKMQQGKKRKEIVWIAENFFWISWSRWICYRSGCPVSMSAFHCSIDKSLGETWEKSDRFSFHVWSHFFFDHPFITLIGVDEKWPFFFSLVLDATDVSIWYQATFFNVLLMAIL